ncbi:hypothetical protein [Pedobacter caeni]|uniref:Uncharacterized protein n=1 Tax=Pedobacter caeni TaxID=288992 RepID=A0A1M4ZB63_9SPHI|nr:hypothetical protein [Pedobacter caeni]SHF15254.1 hypothetical protein SAMN04488522_102259 [Pedobacter caeni]
MYIRHLFLVFFLLISIAVFANMGQPYREGSSHSLLFFGKELEVSAESIKIKVISDDTIQESAYYATQYEISYEVSSGQARLLPLLFIAIGLEDKPLIKINGKIVNAADVKAAMKKGDPKFYPFLKPHDGDDVGVFYEKGKEEIVNVNSLVYFEADLKKGKNTITVAYKAVMGYNTYGFYRSLDIDYALFPSKYWASFGPIKIDLELPEELRLESASVGEARKNKNIYSWTLNKLPEQDLKIVIIPVFSLLSKVLLAISPLGLATIGFSGLFYLHFLALKKRKQAMKTGFNWVLTLGIVFVPVLFYVFFLLAYDLIDWSLAKHSLGRHGYVFLVVLSLPLFWVVYWVLMLWLNSRILTSAEQGK